jgi:SRSO17 transposase
MPQCFENWCSKFDDIFQRTTQQQHFRSYLAGLLSENHRKNVAAIASATVGTAYYNLHHFLHDSPWDAEALNNQRIDVIWQCRQARPAPGFKLIIDDSGHRKSGSATDGVARQYIGQIGKVDNGMVEVTSHLYDGTKGYPLDVAMYKPASTLEKGKEDPEFLKKPELALQLIDKVLKRDLKPGVTLIDSGYGNNGQFLVELEKRELTYIAALNKSRIVYAQLPGEPARNKHRLDDVVMAIAPEQFQKVTLQLDKPRDVWVATISVHFPKLPGTRTVAIQLDAPTLEEAKEVDYFLTNAEPETATAQWITKNYSDRNWIEVFYREAKGWLGMSEYQVRDQRSIERHWILVFNAFTFLTYQRLTGGLRRLWSTEPISTFAHSFRVFRHAVECQLLQWLQTNRDVFAAHRAKLGLVFA